MSNSNVEFLRIRELFLLNIYDIKQQQMIKVSECRKLQIQLQQYSKYKHYFHWLIWNTNTLMRWLGVAVFGFALSFQNITY